MVNRYPNQLLLLLSLGVLVCFAFPQIGRLSYVFYSLIALLLTCGPAGRGHSSAMDDRLYRALGAVAVAAMWLWLITPMNLLASGVPLALSWSVLVGWSLVRMIQSASYADLNNDVPNGRVAAGEGDKDAVRWNNVLFILTSYLGADKMFQLIHVIVHRVIPCQNVPCQQVLCRAVS